MTLPSWHEFMVPVLRLLGDGQKRRLRDLWDEVASTEELSADQRAEMLPSGKPRYENRIAWAVSYLFNAGALDRPSRGVCEINDGGRALIHLHPQVIAEKQLRDWAGEATPSSSIGVPTAATSTATEASTSSTELDPEEQVESGIARIHADVAAGLLARLHAQQPAFFEQAVIDLLVAMGYGGGDLRATRTQLSNDGGIDGIIDQDVLGLSRVYVQAKRYALDSTVDRPAIQGFVGALHGQQANQGVFITTGRFTAGAVKYADGVATRVVLIDGARLASLMIRHGVGVQVRQTFSMVEVDEDFFE